MACLPEDLPAKRKCLQRLDAIESEAGVHSSRPGIRLGCDSRRVSQNNSECGLYWRHWNGRVAFIAEWSITMRLSTSSGSASTPVPGADDTTSQAAVSARRKAFRALHERGCFVIPNPWDVGSARYLQHLGFP